LGCWSGIFSLYMVSFFVLFPKGTCFCLLSPFVPRLKPLGSLGVPSFFLVLFFFERFPPPVRSLPLGGGSFCFVFGSGSANRVFGFFGLSLFPPLLMGCLNLSLLSPCTSFGMKSCFRIFSLVYFLPLFAEESPPFGGRRLSLLAIGPLSDEQIK